MLTMALPPTRASLDEIPDLGYLHGVDFGDWYSKMVHPATNTKNLTDALERAYSRDETEPPRAVLTRRVEPWKYWLPQARFLVDPILNHLNLPAQGESSIALGKGKSLTSNTFQIIAYHETLSSCIIGLGDSVQL